MTSPKEVTELAHLLPFYVNGTLDVSARAQVEAALPGSAELRAALAEERALQALVVAGTQDLLAAGEAGAEARHAAVMAGLSSPAAPAAPAPVRASQGAGSSFALALAFLNPRNWSPAVSLSLALLIPLQGAVIASQSGKLSELRDQNFKLASGPCEDRPLAGAVQLEMNDSASWQGIAALLDNEGLSISKSGDFGTLTIKTGKQGAELSALLARLKASPLVASAELAK